MAQPASDTRTALLDAALECFAHCGFEGTSIRMIADRAGRPLSLISHHFGGKEGLYLEVFRRILMEHQERFLANTSLQELAPTTHEEAVASLREVLRFLYFDLAIKRQRRDPALECGSMLWLREFRSPRPALHELIQTCLGPLVERLRTCLAVLCPDLEPSRMRFLCISILGMVNGHSMMFGLNEVIWGRDENPGDPEEHVERLLAFCLQGLDGFTMSSRTRPA